MAVGHKCVNPFNLFNYLGLVWVLFLIYLTCCLLNGSGEKFYWISIENLPKPISHPKNWNVFKI